MITYNDLIVAQLLPTQQPKNDGRISVQNLLPAITPKKGQFPLESLLLNKIDLQWMVFQFNKNISSDQDSGDNYQRYLQVGNKYIQSLAKGIVKNAKAITNDQKMYAIEQWVIENITYKTDEKNYGMTEYWAMPTLTLSKKSGDCEDGAFLMHSLAVSAGIPYERLRTYGGYVEIEEGVPILGGHAWTAYKRESDEEWVVTDWSYWPTKEPLKNRVSMKNDSRYVDDFFYIDITKTVDAMLTNRIRKPTGHELVGNLINGYA